MISLTQYIEESKYSKIFSAAKPQRGIYPSYKSLKKYNRYKSLERKKAMWRSKHPMQRWEVGDNPEKYNL